MNAKRLRFDSPTTTNAKKALKITDFEMLIKKLNSKNEKEVLSGLNKLKLVSYK